MEQNYYYELHFQLSRKNGDGYSIFFKSNQDVDYEQDIIDLAKKENQLDDSDDVNYIDYAQQIDEDEFVDAMGHN